MRPYRLYLVTAPDGRQYVGMTITPVETRWQGHIGTAFGCYSGSVPRGGIGEALQIHAGVGFSVEHIASAPDKFSAAQAERQLILQHGTLFPRGMNKRTARYAGPPVQRDWLLLGKRRAA